jgi:triosephosphate isomerase
MARNLKKLIVANWKLAPSAWSEARGIFLSVKQSVSRLRRVETVICPPAVWLWPMAERLSGRRLLLGGQDVSWATEGAHTGELSAAMIKHAGAKYVLLGHSERRAASDSDEVINQKIKAALRVGLKVIFCVGERERDPSGEYLNELRRQIEAGLAGIPRKNLDELTVAYEPVWAIGSAAVAADTPAGFLEQALYIRKVLSGLVGAPAALALPVLYGGSVDHKNAVGFLTEGQADGLLVGRASLRVSQFQEIIKLAENIK